MVFLANPFGNMFWHVLKEVSQIFGLTITTAEWICCFFSLANLESLVGKDIACHFGNLFGAICVPNKLVKSSNVIYSWSIRLNR